jgi:hypothetical protein
MNIKLFILAKIHKLTVHKMSDTCISIHKLIFALLDNHNYFAERVTEVRM